MNAFELEHYRNFLAKTNDFKKLASLYGVKNPSIENINSSNFWDKKIEQKEKDCEVSFIEEDRIKIVFEYLKNKKGKLLDLGFGQGKLESLLANDGSVLELNGIDVSRVVVERARAMFKGNFSKGVIKTLPYKYGSFDFLVAMEILEHIPPYEIFRTLSEISRVIKRKGMFILSVPLNEDLEKIIIDTQVNPNGHTRIFTPDLIKAELNIAGFNIVDEIYLSAFNSFYKLKKIIVNLFPNLKQPNNIIVFAQKK